jgi:hypothetical protein
MYWLVCQSVNLDDLKSEEGIIYYDAMDLVNLFVREMGQEK